MTSESVSLELPALSLHVPIICPLMVTVSFDLGRVCPRDVQRARACVLVHERLHFFQGQRDLSLQHRAAVALAALSPLFGAVSF